MAWYDEAAEAKRSGTSFKIDKKGRFRVRIDGIKTQQSQQGFGTVFVAEFTVLESDHPDIDEGPGYAWTQFPESPGAKGQMAKANIASFIAALLGRDPIEGEVSGEEIRNAFGGAYDGREVILMTKVIETKSGFPYTVHNWKPLPEDEQVAPVAATGRSTGAPPVPPVPPADTLTKERWLAGEGPGVTHPQNPNYEYHPEHHDWGVRKKVSDIPF